MPSTVADNPDLAILQQDQSNSVDPNQDTIATPDPEEQQKQKDIADAADEEVKSNLKLVMKLAEDEDLDLRWPLLVKAKRNELYFNNIQTIAYDEVAKDYRSFNDIMNEFGNLPGAGDIKINNIYRAFAESLVAALSVEPPAVEFTPDDAQDPEDLNTAEAFTHASELIARHNKAQLILIKALTILFNQGVIAGYNFTKSDSSYGQVKKHVGSTTKQIPVVDIRCQNCAELLDSSIPVQQFDPKASVTCPTCGNSGPPQPYQVMENLEEPQFEYTPKTRSLYDIFGMTAVKLPLYAKKQSDCGYLVFRVDDHLAKFKAVYDPDETIGLLAGNGDSERWERWARLPVVYGGAIPQSLTTIRYCWMRPWYFYALNDIDKTKTLLDKYPNGVMVAMIGDEIVETTHESMDDCWTISLDPRSSFIHAEPAGNAIIPLQDVENDIFNLGVQSIEYGIPETFADPRTLNFEAYSKSPSAPGLLTKAKPPTPDKALADGFHTLKVATLSTEYTAFTQSLTAKTQFTTGAFPSIFGGNMGDKGSNTATEYTESRARALQRLQLTWQIIASFWGDLTFKAVKLFVKNMTEDEQFSKKEKGTFINVFISRSSMNGRVGLVEPEVNGQLPQSWTQKKDFFMGLIQMQIPQVADILLHPNNCELLKLISGMPDLYIPGQHDYEKQFNEYFELSNGQPLGPNQPSVNIDINVDDHQVHMQVLKNILVSSQGVQLYKTNPAGYENNIFHYIMHEQALQAKTMAPGGGTPENTPPDSATKTTQG